MIAHSGSMVTITNQDIIPLRCHQIAPEVSKVSERKLEGGMMLETGQKMTA